MLVLVPRPRLGVSLTLTYLTIFQQTGILSRNSSLAYRVLRIGQPTPNTERETMTCHDVLHHLVDYLEGKLSGQESWQVGWHVGHCANCRLVLKSAQQTLRKYFTPAALVSRSPRSSHRAAA